MLGHGSRRKGYSGLVLVGVQQQSTPRGVVPAGAVTVKMLDVERADRPPDQLVTPSAARVSRSIV